MYSVRAQNTVSMAQNNADLSAALPSTHPAKDGKYPWQWIIIGIIALYTLLAVLQRKHLQKEIQFHNIIVNLHNFAVIGLSAWIFFILAKLAVVKMSIAKMPWIQKVGNFFKNLLPTN